MYGIVYLSFLAVLRSNLKWEGEIERDGHGPALGNLQLIRTQGPVRSLEEKGKAHV